MSRTVSFRPDRPRLAAWTLAGTLVAACGKEPPKPAAVATEPAPPAVVVPAGGLPPAAPTSAAPAAPSAATYDDAEAAYRAGKFADAKQLFASYLTTKPENPWGHYMLGLAAWKSGDFTTAEKAFDRAIALDPKHVKSHLGAARVLLDQKRAPEAIERIQKALALDSTSADGLRLFARATAEIGDVDGAIEIYRMALVQNDEDYWSMNNLGVLYLDEGNPESAVGPLARAVALRRTAPVFQNNLGMALERTGHFSVAKEAYQAAVRADSTYVKAVKNLERLSAMTIDSTDTTAGFVEDQAEVFRQLVAMWRSR